MTKPGSTSASRSCARRKPISAAGAVNPAQKKLMEDMVEKQRPLRPQERQGLLRLSASKPKRLWPGLAELLPKKLTREQIEALDVEELKQRFLVTQAVEAARTFEEHVVTDVREADVGSILGWGFAPYSGGTLSYIDMMGTKKFVALCRAFEKKYGARFAPPQAPARNGRQGRELLRPLRAGEEERSGVSRPGVSAAPPSPLGEQHAD